MATNSNEDLAFGAVPGSDLDPSTIQAILQNIAAAQQEGGYVPQPQQIQQPPMVRMPALPAVQAVQAPRAPVQGFLSPEGPRQMLAAATLPGLAGLSAAALGGVAGTGSRSGSGGGGSGTSGISRSSAGTLLGGGAGTGSAGGSQGSSLLGTLIKQGLQTAIKQGIQKNTPTLDDILNLFAPQAGTVGGANDFAPLGGNFQDLGPYGTGAQANTTSDILRPTFPSETAPQDFPNEWEGLDSLLTGTEPSTFDVAGLGEAPSVLGDFGGPIGTTEDLGGLLDALGGAAASGEAGGGAGLGALGDIGLESGFTGAGDLAGTAGAGAAGAAGAEAAGGGLGGLLGEGLGAAGLGAAGGLAMAPLIALAFAPLASNSPWGFRPAGWSNYITQQRTAEHHVADVTDTGLSSLASQLAGGVDPASLKDQAVPFLQQLSDPANPVNHNFFGVVDQDITDPLNKAWGPAKGKQVMQNMLTLYNSYKDQLNPVDQAKAVATLNPRLQEVGMTPIDMPHLTEDQISSLPWEYQLIYHPPDRTPGPYSTSMEAY